MKSRYRTIEVGFEHSHKDLRLRDPPLGSSIDALGRPMLGPPREAPETEQFLRETYQDISLVIPAIRDFWMPQRLKQVGRQA